jgi:protein involved in polysaccharide export with SLBB domain
MRMKAVGMWAAALWLGVVPGVVLAQDTTPPTPQLPPSGTLGADTTFEPNQPIKPGFDISVTTSSEAGVETDLTGTFRVDPGGNIVMKIIGPVTVKDLTPAQAADLIAGKVKALIKNPRVTVSILAVPRPSILISGAVSRPGSNPINATTTLAEAVTVFQYTDAADLSRVRVTRRDAAGKVTSTEYNLLRYLRPNRGEAPDESQNPVLQDKDWVYVGDKALPGTGMVTVSGAVARPGVVPLRLGVPTTVREVISLAGGLLPTADRRKVYLRSLSRPDAVIVDADRAEANAATDNLVVQPDDVVYVENLDVDRFIILNGAFIRPGKLPMTKAMTLTQAIAEAGGLAPTAVKHKAVVFRHVSGADPTKTQIIPFNYDKIRKNQQQDIMLEPGDAIDVEIGAGPRQPLSGLEIAQSLLSIALIVDRIFSGDSRRF